MSKPAKLSETTTTPANLTKPNTLNLTVYTKNYHRTLQTKSKPTLKAK